MMMHCAMVSRNLVPMCPYYGSSLGGAAAASKSSSDGMKIFLVHLSDESVDVVLAVAGGTTLDEVVELSALEATVGAGKLEWPEERRDLLEVGAGGVDLVDDVLNGNDAVLAEIGLDDLVVGKRQALLVDLAVSSLVDELTDGLQVGLTVGNVRLNKLEHL